MKTILHILETLACLAAGILLLLAATGCNGEVKASPAPVAKRIPAQTIVILPTAPPLAEIPASPATPPVVEISEPTPAKEERPDDGVKVGSAFEMPDGSVYMKTAPGVWSIRKCHGTYCTWEITDWQPTSTQAFHMRGIVRAKEAPPTSSVLTKSTANHAQVASGDCGGPVRGKARALAGKALAPVRYVRERQPVRRAGRFLLRR